MVSKPLKNYAKITFSDVLNQINSNLDQIHRIKLKAANKKYNVQKYADWAYMIQNVSEKIMIKLESLYEKKQKQNLCSRWCSS